MVPKPKKQHKPQGIFTNIAIRIERCEDKVSAGFNNNVFEPQYAFRLDDEDPLYQCTNQVILNGVAKSPDDRASDIYELTIVGDDSRSSRHDLIPHGIQPRCSPGNNITFPV